VAARGNMYRVCDHHHTRASVLQPPHIFYIFPPPSPSPPPTHTHTRTHAHTHARTHTRTQVMHTRTQVMGVLLQHVQAFGIKLAELQVRRSVCSPATITTTSTTVWCLGGGGGV